MESGGAEVVAGGCCVRVLVSGGDYFLGGSLDRVEEGRAYRRYSHIINLTLSTPPLAAH